MKVVRGKKWFHFKLVMRIYHHEEIIACKFNLVVQDTLEKEEELYFKVYYYIKVLKSNII